MIAIIDCGTSELEHIIGNIISLGYNQTVIKLERIKDTDFSIFSSIIISGAPTLLTEVNMESYIELFAFVKELEIPVLGICLGHQILGLLYGAKIFLGGYTEKMESIEILEHNGLFEGLPNSALFQEAHSEYITLPIGFTLLARSDSCMNEAMKHKNRDIYGVQFHPEISGENGAKVFRNFLTGHPRIA